MAKGFSVVDLRQQVRRLDMYPCVQRAGFRENERVIPRRRMKNLQICFRLCGTAERMRTAIDGKIYEAPFPHLLIKRPGELHENTPAAIQFSTLYFVYPANSSVAGILPPQLVMEQIPFEGHLPVLFNTLQNTLEHPDDPGVCDRVDELCYRFLFELLMMWKNASQPSPAPESRIGQAVFWLRSHHTGSVIWEDVAAKFGFSLRSFCRHWRSAMKESPGQTLMRFRMEEAQQLLTESTFSVAELAARFGYAAPETFIKAFRSYTGMTPLNFRKNSRSHIVNEASEFFLKHN